MTTAAPRFVSDGDWDVDAVLQLGDNPLAGPVTLSVRNGVIVALDTRGRAGPDGATDRCLVMAPLLVNAHDHGRGAGHVRAGIADAPLEPWIESLGRPGAASTQAALIGDGCRAMLASGVGATVLCVNPQSADTAAEVIAAATAVSRLGLRAAVVYPFADTMSDLYGRARDAAGWSPAEVAGRLAAVDAVAAAIDDAGIEIQLGPVGPQWVSESTLTAVAGHAAATGRRVHMHLLESRAQRAWVDRMYPEGIVEALRRWGLLGPHVCLAHGTHLRPDEMAGLAEHGAVVAFNASSNLRLASGIPPLAGALASPLDIGAGLDGLALGDDADYWNELRLLRGLSQAQSGRSTDARVLLQRVSAGGRQALGASAPDDPGLGRVADFILLDLTGYRHLLDDHGWSVADVVLAAGRPNGVVECWVSGRRVYARDSHCQRSGSRGV